MDHSKAFDSVNHHIVLRKLSEAACPPVLTRWAAAFLLNRRQRVRIGNNYSSMVTLNGGTPRVLFFGPLSFLVHLRDFATPEAEDYIYMSMTLPPVLNR